MYKTFYIGMWHYNKIKYSVLSILKGNISGHV